MGINNQNYFYNNNENIIENEEELNVDNKDEEESVYPMDGIKVDKGFYTVFELKRKFDKHDKGIVLDSDFQRRSVWTATQKSELIESVLMGLPLPIFYFNEDKKGRLIVIDGRQRLTALFEYLNDEFALGEMKILKKISKKRFSNLDPLQRSKLEDYQILSHVIQPPTPDRVKFDIFERVNRAGTQLNKQEIRNALYQGNATRLLDKLRELNVFELATDKAFLKDKRMKDEYIILRFLAFYLYFNKMLTFIENGEIKVYQYRNDIDELLGLTMDYINTIDNNQLSELEEITINALKNCCFYFQKNAFRLTEIKEDGILKRYPININIFETVLYAMTLLPQENENLKEYISSAILDMKNSKEFRDSIYNHRDSEGKVMIRYNLAMDIIKGVIKND